jgi:hypothetical protein
MHFCKPSHLHHVEHVLEPIHAEQEGNRRDKEERHEQQRHHRRVNKHVVCENPIKAQRASNNAIRKTGRIQQPRG